MEKFIDLFKYLFILPSAESDDDKIIFSDSHGDMYSISRKDKSVKRYENDEYALIPGEVMFCFNILEHDIVVSAWVEKMENNGFFLEIGEEIESDDFGHADISFIKAYNIEMFENALKTEVPLGNVLKFLINFKDSNEDKFPDDKFYTFSYDVERVLYVPLFEEFKKITKGYSLSEGSVTIFDVILGILGYVFPRFVDVDKFAQLSEFSRNQKYKALFHPTYTKVTIRQGHSEKVYNEVPEYVLKDVQHLIENN